MAFRRNEMTKQYLVEFLGTFFLVLVIALTGNPLAIGVTLTALVYMGGYLSGAHYNPAVTLAMLINKKITSKAAAFYIITQFLAGFLTAAVFFFIQENKFIPQPGKNASTASVFLIETLFTFLLAFVVLHVAATKKTKDNHYFGLAIGFTLMAGVFAGGPISGGVFNPAVALGPFFFDFPNIINHLTIITIYLFGPFLGGAFAGLLYKYFFS